MDVKKLAKKTGVTLLCILFLFSVFSQLYNHDYTGFRERWLQCLDYLAEGTFWRGQPYCDGGPLVYYIAYATRFFVGQERFQLMMLIESFLLCAGLFYMAYNVYTRERGNEKKNMFLFTALFLFLIYINTLREFETALMSFAIFGGYYCLFYLESKQKELLAGIFFAIAMLSKFNALILFGLIGICYMFKENIIHYKEKKIFIEKDKKKYVKGLKILLPTILAYLYFRIKYDYFFIYLFLVQTKQDIALSIFETIKTFLTLNFNNISINIFPLLFLILLCWYEFYREIKQHQEQTYTFLASVGLPISIFLIIKSFGIPEYFLSDFRYWVPFMPFVILSILRLYHIIEEEKDLLRKALCTVFLATIIIYPGAYYSPLTNTLSTLNPVANLHPFAQERYNFMSMLNYGYSAIPEQDGEILVEWGLPHYIDELYAQFNISIPREKLFSITNTMVPTHPDVWQFPRFQELLGDNLLYDPNAEQTLTTAEQELVQKINNKEFSLLIFGPPDWFAMQRILSNVDLQSLGFCGVIIPDNMWLTREGWHFSYFYFKEQEDCLLVAENMAMYYNQMFDAICEQDEASANEIVHILALNGMTLEKTCNSGNAILEEFRADTSRKRWQFVIMAIVMACAAIWNIKRGKEEIKK